jgi:hypothetical protein
VTAAGKQAAQEAAAAVWGAEAPKEPTKDDEYEEYFRGMFA